MCIVALSVSGETTEIIQYLNHLNLSESSVIGITSSSNSTLSKLVDIAITYNISLEKLMKLILQHRYRQCTLLKS